MNERMLKLSRQAKCLEETESEPGVMARQRYFHGYAVATHFTRSHSHALVLSCALTIISLNTELHRYFQMTN